MGRVADEPRNEAGLRGAGSDVLELVPDLRGDPEALRDHILRQAAEISDLKAALSDLRAFTTLAVGCALTVVQRSESLRNVL